MQGDPRAFCQNTALPSLCSNRVGMRTLMGLESTGLGAGCAAAAAAAYAAAAGESLVRRRFRGRLANFQGLRVDAAAVISAVVAPKIRGRSVVRKRLLLLPGRRQGAQCLTLRHILGTERTVYARGLIVDGFAFDRLDTRMKR